MGDIPAPCHGDDPSLSETRIKVRETSEFACICEMKFPAAANLPLLVAATPVFATGDPELHLGFADRSPFPAIIMFFSDRFPTARFLD